MGDSRRQKAWSKFNPVIAVRDFSGGIFSLDISWQLLDLHDVVDVSISRGAGEVSIFSDDPRVPSGRGDQASGNNCHGACCLMQKIAGSQAEGWDISVYIQKRIPFAGGLGGSATDASAVVRALNSIFGLQLDSMELSAASVTLGHDCAFFSLGEVAAKGGEKRDQQVRIEPIPSLVGVSAVGIYPSAGMGIYSGGVYSSLAQVPMELLLKSDSFSGNMKEYQECVEKGEYYRALTSMGNDLEKAPLIAENTDIPVMRNLLDKSGAIVTMLSGSGPTLLGFFESDRDVAAFLKKNCDNSRYTIFPLKPQFDFD
ncbi:MAG: hypothetical protein CVV64_07130 [Candidatus Wallbacteria bacterium HGW-Wallbacteria-1]|jgi:4-diphosphocytidyl-2-C-methyl-D-erythritol kinase|uniref:Uncharacterized protein n=1 Tax=Candidatus Wallbacteria bacterium HGW-Wallbacteria-1 TaxID=2013854 RepID=A0A2N1PT67_9BACT|nr:MAG: hypothetical protein CVV64_07130 [Candidatus Wallbacteria bacterium HGW-Wallbacteria-1]